MKRSRDDDDQEEMSISPVNEEPVASKRQRFSRDEVTPQSHPNPSHHFLPPLPPLSSSSAFSNHNHSSFPPPISIASRSTNHGFQVPVPPSVDMFSPQKILEKLLKQLDLDSKTRDSAWSLFSVLLSKQENLRDDTSAHEELYIAATIVIWIVRKADCIEWSIREGQQRSNLFHVSRCIRALGAFVHKYKSPEVYLGKDFEDFINKLGHHFALVKASIPPTTAEALEKVLNDTKRISDSIISAYNFTKYLVTTLLKPEVTNGGTFFNDFSKMSWVLFLYCREITLENDYQPQNMKTLCILVALFATTQIPSNMRATIQSVANHLKSHSSALSAWDVPPVDASNPSNNDWISQFEHIKQALRIVAGIPDSTFLQITHQFHITIETLKRQSCLLSDSDDVLTSLIPWKLYVKAFETGPGGLLHCNAQTIHRLYATRAKERGYEIDYVTVRPTVGGMITSTPIRFSRTPRQSVLKTASRSLSKCFSEASNMAKSFKGTPLSAKVSRQTVSTDIQGVQQSLSDSFREVSPNVELYLDEIQFFEPTIRQSIRSRVECFADVLRRKMPHDRVQIEMAFKFYCKVLVDLAKTPTMPEGSQLNKIMSDSSFHRCLIFISCQSIFYIFKVLGASFRDLVAMMDVHLTDLCLMISIVLDNQSWLPAPIYKKFKEIEERILESELWTDHSFRQYLKTVDSSSSQPNTSTGAFGPVKPTLVSSQVGRLYLAMKLPHVYTAFLPVEHQATADEQNAFNAKPFECLFQKSREMSLIRLHNVCDGLNASHAMREKATSIFETIIHREYVLRLVANRHLDVIITCCIFAAGRSTDRPQLLFKEIHGVYRTQPQFFDESFTKIHMDGQGRVEIVKFYNLEFSAKYRLFEKALSGAMSGKENVMSRSLPLPRPSGPHSQPIPPAQFQIPAIPPHMQAHLKPNMLGMTPVTKKLYNHTESPFKVSSANASPTPLGSGRKSLFGKPPLPPTQP